MNGTGSGNFVENTASPEELWSVMNRLGCRRPFSSAVGICSEAIVKSLLWSFQIASD